MVNTGRRAPTAQYGRACLACVQSKCRCVPREGTAGCERCFRSHRECVPSDSPRRRAGERNASIARIIQLEQKLNTVVSSIADGNAPYAPPGSTYRQPQPQSAGEPEPGGGNRPPPAAPALLCDDAAASPSSASAAHAHSPQPSGYYETFCRRMLRYFPIVHVPPTPELLHQDRPFLLLCIKAVALAGTQAKLALGAHIKKTVAARLVMDEDTGYADMDLLQGLLTFITWGHDTLVRGSPGQNVSRLTDTALALMHELRLNKMDASPTANMLPVGDIPGKRRMPRRLRPHTMDERRTLAACFVLSSVVSGYFGQIDPVPWSDCIESCLESLQSSDESPFDETLAFLVYVQNLVNEIEVVGRRPASSSDFYYKPFQMRAAELERSMPRCTETRAVVMSSIYFARLQGQALSLLDGAEPRLDRVTLMCTCLETVQHALENFFATPLEDYEILSFPHFTRTAGFLAVLIRLSTHQAPWWDTDKVRETVDVLVVIQRIIDSVNAARDMVAAAGSESRYLERAATIFTSCKMACATKVGLASRARARAGGGGGGGEMDDGGLGGMRDEADEAWFGGVFGYGLLGVSGIMM